MVPQSHGDDDGDDDDEHGDGGGDDDDDDDDDASHKAFLAELTASTCFLKETDVQSCLQNAVDYELFTAKIT